MKILICGHEYEIVYVDDFRGEEEKLIGRVIHGHHIIEIRDSLPQSQKIETLLHEIGHCILWHYGHNSEEIRGENVIDAFANGLFELGVGEFLLEKAKKEGKRG